MSGFDGKRKVLEEEFVLFRLNKLVSKLENVKSVVVFGSLARDSTLAINQPKSIAVS